MKFQNRFLALVAFAVMFSMMQVPAIADWREDMGRFRIGVMQPAPAENAMLELEPFRLAIEEKLGLTVEIVAFSNLERLARAHAGGRVEYAVYPATTYAATWINCECVEPLVATLADDRTAGAHSVLITRRNSGIRRPADLSGKQVWLLDENGVLTHHYAVHAMRQEAPGFDKDAVDWLTGDNPRAVIDRFVQGEGDALIGWSSLAGDMGQVYSRGTPILIAEKAGDFSQYVLAWQSKPLSHHVHAIRKKVDGEAKKLLREVLGNMSTMDAVAYDSIEPVFGGGFQTVPHSSFSTAISFVRSMMPNNDADAQEMEEGSQGDLVTEDPAGSGDLN